MKAIFGIIIFAFIGISSSTVTFPVASVKIESIDKLQNTSIDDYANNIANQWSLIGDSRLSYEVIVLV